MFHLRKKAYGKYEPPKLHDHLTKMVAMGKYDSHILEDYSQSEIELMDEYIDHRRDMSEIVIWIVNIMEVRMELRKAELLSRCSETQVEVHNVGFVQHHLP